MTNEFIQDVFDNVHFPTMSRFILDINSDTTNELNEVGKIITLYRYIYTNQEEIQNAVIQRDTYKNLYGIILTQISVLTTECIENMRIVLSHIDYEEDHDSIMKNIGIIREYNTCMEIMNSVKDRALQGGFQF
jgi:hypothetical protein